jgi:hypothetical protein
LLPGVIQVPGNGQPIVLMNDAQTTGGYPRIACIIEADRYHLAQIPLGQPIHFVQCSLEEALKARRISSVIWNSWRGGLMVKIDLNADLGEGAAPTRADDAGLFGQYRLRLSRGRCANHAGERA